MVQKQVKLDQDVMSLLETINNTFTLVQNADILDSKSQIILRMVQQTTECAWFIHDYIKTAEFCELDTLFLASLLRFV